MNVNPLSPDRLVGIFRTSPKDPLRIINREGTTIEFKESYNNANMAQYFKAIASFANNAGGYIIFGVGDKPRCLLGLQNKSLQQFEELKVEEFTKALLDYFAPEIKWDHCPFEYKGKSFGVIYVFPLEYKPCVCKKHYDTMNAKCALKEGDIYYRYGGRSERIHYSELINIIDESRKKEEKQWLEFAQKATQIGVSNVCLLDLKSGNLTGKGGTIILDDKLLQKISFIREGEFVEEKGKPALRLIGDVQEISHGKIIVKETTKRVVKAIEPSDIIETFLKGEKVDEPLEYVKMVCSTTSANYPVYFFIQQSKLTISEVLQAIESTPARGIAKTKLIDRLNGKTIEQKKLPTAKTTASIMKNKYREQWIKEIIPDTIENISYCLQSILLLTSEEIIDHKVFICSKLLNIFISYYEKSNSIIASYIRVSICRIDEALNLIS